MRECAYCPRCDDDGRLDDADELIEEIREIRRQMSAEFGDAIVALSAYLMDYQKQFGDRLVTGEQLDARRAAAEGDAEIPLSNDER